MKWLYLAYQVGTAPVALGEMLGPCSVAPPTSLSETKVPLEGDQPYTWGETSEGVYIVGRGRRLVFNKRMLVCWGTITE